MSREIVVFLPVSDLGATTEIAAGSAVLGRPEPGCDEVEVYFEGNLHGAVNMATLADRALHAAGRMVHDYPTVAKMTVPRAALVAVGTFDPRAAKIELTGPDSERAVAFWLGAQELDPAELQIGRPPRSA
jgi:hypothetical protein